MFRLASKSTFVERLRRFSPDSIPWRDGKRALPEEGYTPQECPLQYLLVLGHESQDYTSWVDSAEAISTVTNDFSQFPHRRPYARGNK